MRETIQEHDGEHHDPKVPLWLAATYTASQHITNLALLEADMSAAKITQAQVKGLRHQFAALGQAVLEFCRKLYAAHGGLPRDIVCETSMSPGQVLALADRYQGYSPNLSAQLRYLVSKG
jgi:tRNA(Ile)-lysidine synthase TilS/MesJ